MIIFLISIIASIIGLFLMQHSTLRSSLAYDFISLLMSVSGLTGVIVSLIVIILAHTSVDQQIYEAQIERESIIKQYECINNDYEDLSSINVIKNIYDWNKEVHSAKYYSESPWTNWFYSKKYVHSLKYIEGDIQC